MHFERDTYALVPLFIPLNRLKVNLHCDNRDLDDVPNIMKAHAEHFHLYFFEAVSFYEIMRFNSMNIYFALPNINCRKPNIAQCLLLV